MTFPISPHNELINKLKYKLCRRSAAAGYTFESYKYLAVMNSCWGYGVDPDAALAQLRVSASTAALEAA